MCAGALQKHFGHGKKRIGDGGRFKLFGNFIEGDGLGKKLDRDGGGMDLGFSGALRLIATISGAARRLGSGSALANVGACLSTKWGATCRGTVAITGAGTAGIGTLPLTLAGTRAAGSVALVGWSLTGGTLASWAGAAVAPVGTFAAGGFFAAVIGIRRGGGIFFKPRRQEAQIKRDGGIGIAHGEVL